MTTLSHSVHMTRRSFSFIVLLLLTLALLSLPVSAAPGDTADSVVIFTQDISVIVGSTLREPDDTTAPEAPLFTDSAVNMDLTWGEWQAATATASAKVKKGPTTEIKIELAGLVPGGIYSVFYGTLYPDSVNPLCPGVERTLALTSTKANLPGPDASSFVAHADGTASYRGEVEGDLLGIANQQVFYSIIYHFDGATWHPYPNHGEFNACHSSFGEDAMRQLIIIQK